MLDETYHCPLSSMLPLGYIEASALSDTDAMGRGVGSPASSQLRLGAGSLVRDGL
jgi:hypothetical protein